MVVAAAALRAGVGKRQGRGELVAQRVVGVRGEAAKRVGAAGHVAVGVVGELARRGGLRGDVVADGPGLQRAIRVEDEAGERGPAPLMVSVTLCGL